MTGQPRPPAQWSSAVEEARWIAERLDGFAERVTSIVPHGFDAYCRILHPVEEPTKGGRLVRWRDVAQWSGIDLRPDAQFHAVALPRVAPQAPPPWRGQGPDQGRLYAPDAEVVAELLRGGTSTPEACFFGLWEGYDLAGTPLVGEGSAPAEPLCDPVPEAVRAGPVFELPHRRYLLYEGPVEALYTPPLELDELSVPRNQTANLAWPTDHAWCLASEIDFASTYVAGSEALVRSLVADERIECLRVGPDDPVNRVEPFVTELADQAVAELLEHGHAFVTTAMGTVEAWLERPTRLRWGALRLRYECFDGSSGSSNRPLRRGEDLRAAAELDLVTAIVGLVELW